MDWREAFPSDIASQKLSLQRLNAQHVSTASSLIWQRFQREQHFQRFDSPAPQGLSGVTVEDCICPPVVNLPQSTATSRRLPRSPLENQPPQSAVEFISTSPSFRGGAHVVSGSLSAIRLNVAYPGRLLVSLFGTVLPEVLLHPLAFPATQSGSLKTGFQVPEAQRILWVRILSADIQG